VRPSLVLCTRSPTPATILIVTCHTAPATCTPRDKQTRFSERNKDKRKIKRNYPGFEFKLRQVNDSSQSNQGTDHLVSHLNHLYQHKNNLFIHIEDIVMEELSTPDMVEQHRQLNRLLEATVSDQ
jgi:hypothetical protein